MKRRTKGWHNLPLRAVDNARRIALAWRMRNAWDELVVHSRRHATLPLDLSVPLLCGPVRGRFRSPPDLTIILIHDYATEPVMERSLRYIGINDFVTIRPVVNGPWRGAMKLTALRDYLASGACTTEYVLYCDADDAVIRDDPAKAVAILRDYGCDLLFSKTSFDGGYDAMPDEKAWADAQAEEHGYPPCYINTGVFVGRTAFVHEVIEAATEYITDEDLTRQEQIELRNAGRLADRLPDYPRGVGCDQQIIRYLHRRFHPRLRLDHEGRLAAR